MNNKLKNFMIDDLIKLEIHVNELIENIYIRGQEDNFKHDIEQIEDFFSYWKAHIKNI